MAAFAFVIAMSMVLLHGLDLLVEWPFFGASKAYDAIACVSGIVLVTLCFPVYRKLPKYAAKIR